MQREPSWEGAGVKWTVIVLSVSGLMLTYTTFFKPRN